jgi:hypothetical protein
MKYLQLKERGSFIFILEQHLFNELDQLLGVAILLSFENGIFYQFLINLSDWVIVVSCTICKLFLIRLYSLMWVFLRQSSQVRRHRFCRGQRVGWVLVRHIVTIIEVKDRLCHYRLESSYSLFRYQRINHAPGNNEK